ncbi:hypothetical protein Pla100_38190 [Neorhodopirellula pilleata]|uniref:Uncharacterized protein n=1 Tax=Neorhodopirellula pilleata TaxID=2714738 RepID=A0A5C6A3Y7_9BACT|nr:hypothetical protein Pla100_38190 [Neorhodopirellula pilleata]
MLETMIASFVLLISLAALGLQTSVGTKAARRAQLQTQSAILAASKLDELVATRTFAVTTSPQPFGDHPEWNYTVSLESVDRVGQLADMGDPANLILLSIATWKTGGEAHQSRTTLRKIIRRSISSDWDAPISGTAR